MSPAQPMPQTEDQKTMSVLVTGGAGYIGTHCIIALLLQGFDVVVIDNYANSNKEALRRVDTIVRDRLPSDRTLPHIKSYEVDMTDKDALREVFAKHKIDIIIHLAGLKAVGESVQNPLLYYRNNLMSSINLFDCMSEFGVARIIFSSSATVYGVPSEIPLRESSTVGQNISNPYGQTKYMIEKMLEDMVISKQLPNLSVVILRYFNPVGSDESGLIGESPIGTPANLMPFVAQVATGIRSKVGVFGNDYDTPDGTGVRDYIHVVDLADGHVASIKKLEEPGVHIYNLGTGRGYSVLEMIKAFEKASNKTIAYSIEPRREGDLGLVVCDASKAKEELNWEARYDLDRMCQDLWRWQSKNPKGYDAAE